MRRLPIIPTIIVALAVATMTGLGLWQLRVRLPQKEAQLAQLAANPSRAAVPFPTEPDDSLLFRPSVAQCDKVTGITRAGAGNAGYRLIATCITRGGGAPIKVQLGTTRDPTRMVDWRGGTVRGWISHAPDQTPLIATLFRRRSQEMLLVAAAPAEGLAANSRPDVGLVPNNHLAYAGQWFFFAGIAALIYLIALRRRLATRP